MKPTIEEILSKLKEIMKINDIAYMILNNDQSGAILFDSDYWGESEELFYFDSLTDFMQKADEYIKANVE